MPKYYCNLCDLYLRSPIDVRNHLSGPMHARAKLVSRVMFFVLFFVCLFVFCFSLKVFVLLCFVLFVVRVY